MIGYDMIWLDMIRLDMIGYDMIGYDMIGYDWIGYDWIGYVCIIVFMKVFIWLGSFEDSLLLFSVNTDFFNI